MAALSSISMDASTKDAFESLKLKGLPRFITMKIDNGSVTVDQHGSDESDAEALVHALPEAECRYACFDHRGVDKDGCHKSKLIFVVWSPDSAPVKQKMMYTSAKQNFKEMLDGVSCEVQATEVNELTDASFRQKAGF